MLKQSMGLMAVAYVVGSADAADIKISQLVVAKTLPASQAASETKTANAFYQFWNTGNESLLTGGDITVWAEQSGAIMLKVREPFGDPVELGEEDALELGALLVRLAKDD